MDNEELERQYTITANSTKMLHVPSLIVHAQHIFAQSDKGKKKAVQIMGTLFDSQVSIAALVSILTKQRMPLFDMDDITNGAETYSFIYEELTEEAKQRVSNLS